MKRAVLVAIGTAIGVAAPAQAAEIPVPEATEAINTACRTGLDALRSSGGRIDDTFEEVDAGGKYHRVFDAAAGILHTYSDPVSPIVYWDRPSQTRQYIVDEVGTYRRLEFHYLTDAERKRVLKRYLKRPKVRYYRVKNQYPLRLGEWTREFDRSFDELVTCWWPSPPAGATAADFAEEGEFATWLLDFDADRHMSFTADGDGRLITTREYYGDGSSEDDYYDGRDLSYEPQSLSAPSAAKTVSWKKYSRAAAAVSLNKDLRAATRRVARDYNGGDITTVREVRQRLRSELDNYGDEALPLKYSSVARGGLGYRTNPFTKTYHAWSVTVRDGVARARKVSP